MTLFQWQTRVVACRETISACAKKHGMMATLLPKVIADAAGNGMHLHMSLASKGLNIFPDATHATGMSATGRAFMAGILEHLPSLMAVTTPTANSFRRLGPGCWAGAFRCWGFENKDRVSDADHAAIEAKHTEEAQSNQDVAEGWVWHLKLAPGVKTVASLVVVF